MKHSTIPFPSPGAAKQPRASGPLPRPRPLPQGPVLAVRPPTAKPWPVGGRPSSLTCSASGVHFGTMTLLLDAFWVENPASLSLRLYLRGGGAFEPILH